MIACYSKEAEQHASSILSPQQTINPQIPALSHMAVPNVQQDPQPAAKKEKLLAPTTAKKGPANGNAAQQPKKQASLMNFFK